MSGYSRVKERQYCKLFDYQLLKTPPTNQKLVSCIISALPISSLKVDLKIIDPRPEIAQEADSIIILPTRLVL